MALNKSLLNSVLLICLEQCCSIELSMIMEMSYSRLSRMIALWLLSAWNVPTATECSIVLSPALKQWSARIALNIEKEIHSVQKYFWLPGKLYGVHQRTLLPSIWWSHLNAISLWNWTGWYLHSRSRDGNWKGKHPEMFSISEIMGRNNERVPRVPAYFLALPVELSGTVSSFLGYPEWTGM